MLQSINKIIDWYIFIYCTTTPNIISFNSACCERFLLDLIIYFLFRISSKDISEM